MTKFISLVLCICFIMQFPQAIKANTNAYLPDANNGTRLETRVYLRSQCLLSEAKDTTSSSPQFVGALAAIFIPLLIEKALGGVSAALKKAGSPETLKDFGRRPTYLYRISNEESKIKYQLNPDNKCVIVVRGTFSKRDEIEDFAQSTIDFSDGEGIFSQADQEQKRITRLNNSKIPVKTIAIIYEAKINLSDDKTAMHYESMFLEVNSFQGKKSSDKRTIVVSLSFYGVGPKEGEPTLSLALMNLGEVKKDTILGPDNLKQQNSTWLGGVGISEASLKAVEKMEVEADKPQGLMPVTVEGMFVETAKGNDALLFIADVLDTKKSDVAKTISEEILKDEGKEAATAADALEKLKGEEESAYTTYLKATVELDKICSAILADKPYTEAQKIILFERDRTYRIWSLKYDSLKKHGATPDGRPTTKFACQNEH